MVSLSLKDPSWLETLIRFSFRLPRLHQDWVGPWTGCCFPPSGEIHIWEICHRSLLGWPCKEGAPWGAGKFGKAGPIMLFNIRLPYNCKPLWNSGCQSPWGPEELNVGCFGEGRCSYSDPHLHSPVWESSSDGGGADVGVLEQDGQADHHHRRDRESV